MKKDLSFEIVVIGGGISGLYLAYKLQYNYKILLIEKSNYLGGRIHTYVCNVENKKCRYEAGAGRIASNHKLMLKLIEELGFKDKLVQVPTTKKHIHNYTTNLIYVIVLFMKTMKMELRYINENIYYLG